MSVVCRWVTVAKAGGEDSGLFFLTERGPEECSILCAESLRSAVPIPIPETRALPHLPTCHMLCLLGFKSGSENQGKQMKTHHPNNSRLVLVRSRYALKATCAWSLILSASCEVYVQSSHSTGEDPDAWEVVPSARWPSDDGTARIFLQLGGTPGSHWGAALVPL